MDARGDVWTARRVAEVIAKTFGVRYHRDHVGKLIREAGWSRQKPVERASQRNARGAQAVVGGALAPDQKKADEDKATIVWVDEAGFYPAFDGGAHLGATRQDACTAGATHARSPDLRISGMTLDGRLFMQVRPASYDAEAVVGALRVYSYARLRARSSSSGMARPSTGRTCSKTFGSRGAAKRLHLEQLPGYAPDLNPDEGILNYREAGLNWAMSVVPTSTTYSVKLFAPKSACSTKRRSSSAALANVVTWFSFLLQDQ